LTTSSVVGPADVRRGPILFLHPSDEAYGADRVLLDTVEAAVLQGRRVEVLLGDDGPPGWLWSALLARGIDCKRVDLAPVRRRYLHPTKLPRLVVSMLRARNTIRSRARAIEAEIVHVNTSALLVAAIVGRPGGAKLTWHVHEIIGRPRLLALVFRTLPITASDRVVVISAAVGRHMRPSWLAHRRVTIVHNGIAPRERAPAALPALGEPKVAFVGRLNQWKGYEVFVEAARRVGARHASVGFVIAGSPPAGEEWRTDDLKTRADESGLGDRMTILGYWPDVPGLFDAVQIAVVPSLWPEPFGMVILEAMRSGCAVVATNHGGAPEIIEDEVSGLLVPPGDAEALAAAIERLVDDETLRRRLGQAAVQRVLASFTLARFRESMVAVWDEQRRRPKDQDARRSP
jgi:glycosyltransferase involved in cell wall biosynthesis